MRRYKGSMTGAARKEGEHKSVKERTSDKRSQLFPDLLANVHDILSL